MVWAVLGSSIYAYCTRASVEPYPAPAISAYHGRLFHETLEDKRFGIVTRTELLDQQMCLFQYDRMCQRPRSQHS